MKKTMAGLILLFLFLGMAPQHGLAGAQDDIVKCELEEENCIHEHLHIVVLGLFSFSFFCGFFPGSRLFQEHLET